MALVHALPFGGTRSAKLFVTAVDEYVSSRELVNLPLDLCLSAYAERDGAVRR
jgi:hypothetical protein